MALQSAQTYHKMQEIFVMFENGELKGQKGNSYTTATSRKRALQGQCSAKAHHFKAFQGLEVTHCSTAFAYAYTVLSEVETQLSMYKIINQQHSIARYHRMPKYVTSCLNCMVHTLAMGVWIKWNVWIIEF